MPVPGIDNRGQLRLPRGLLRIGRGSTGEIDGKRLIIRANCHLGTVLRLTFAIPVSKLATSATLAPGRAGVVRLDVSCAAGSISVARACAFALAARMEERLEGTAFQAVLDPPEVERERRDHYRLRLDLELVHDADEPAALEFVQAFAVAMGESVS